MVRCLQDSMQMTPGWMCWGFGVMFREGVSCQEEYPGEISGGMSSGTCSWRWSLERCRLKVMGSCGKLYNREVWRVNLALFSVSYVNGDCPDAVSKPYQASLRFAKFLGISMYKNKKLAC